MVATYGVHDLCSANPPHLSNRSAPVRLTEAQRLRRPSMHSRIARCCAVVSATVLLWNCDARQPLQPVADEDLVASAANQKGPSSLAANALPGAISLGWQDNSPNEIGFQVLRSTTGASGTFTTITTTAANVTVYTDTGLDPNQQYC